MIRRPYKLAACLLVFVLGLAAWAQADATLRSGPPDGGLRPSSAHHSGLREGGSTSDWPMWRHDAARSAATPAGLPAELRLQWVRRLPAPQPAWPQQQDDSDKLQFDVSYAPVVMGKTLFVASMMEDCLTAFDTETGAERWRFFGDGPMRLAPAAWQGKVYVVSDDGHLYCLDAETGALHWKFRGAPSDRRVLGNGRLISMWPARGGPVIRDGVVYFTAGLWPFMGIFIAALDAETGKALWINSGTGSVWVQQPHYTPSFAGAAPQGYLTATADALLIPGGRTAPVCLDRANGVLRHLDFTGRTFGKNAGGYAAPAQAEWFFNGFGMYSLTDGTPLVRKKPAVLTEGTLIVLETNGPVAYAGRPDVQEVERTNKLGKTSRVNVYSVRELWRANVEFETLFLQAGSRLYGSGKKGRIFAMEMPQGDRPAALSWKDRVKGDVWDMLAADDRLFVVTRQGAIYCFGGEKVSRRVYKPESPPSERGDVCEWRAKSFLKQTGVSDGYAYVVGEAWGRLGGPRLAEELARQSRLQIMVLEPNSNRVAGLREHMFKAGLYGTRVAVSSGALDSFPPYLAELIVVEEHSPVSEPGFVESLFRLLRPYGGVACLALGEDEHKAFADRVAKAGLAKAEVRRQDGFTLLVRSGALPGTADWTHQHADAGNTLCSPDSAVRAPLGLLWFGGPPNEKVLPRHGHGPSPQVAGGRLFIMGSDGLSARDVYTGRTLWEVALPGIGKAYDNTVHQPGANALGGNYVSSPHGIYVHMGRSCLRLNPTNGETLSRFRLPVKGAAPPPHGYIGLWEDLLILTARPQIFNEEPPGSNNWNATSSTRLLVMDRNSGKTLWSRDAEFGLRHTAIAAGDGKLFCIDRLPDTLLATASRRGEPLTNVPQLLAFDIRSGAELWRATNAVFGTWLGYSAARDVLIQSGRPSRDMLSGEPGDRIVAFRGRDGTVLWDQTNSYEGPLILHGDRIISSARGGLMLDLLTGAIVNRRHPLTGRELPWTYSRQYGCGTVLACEHLLTFRSGAAGYYDLDADAGTGNFGGFKSGCTDNLVPADGVLNAPDYTRTCTCSYQLQTSLALVHMPEVEQWTWTNIKLDLAQDGRVRQVGINFGAPGDHRAGDGALWLDYPSVGGPSPDIPIVCEPTNIVWFRRHTATMAGGPLPWVGASGLEGAARLVLTLNASGLLTNAGSMISNSPAEAVYTVRLVFSEPEDIQPGERVFDVALQEEDVLTRFDIVKEAGGPRRSIVREFPDVVIGDTLQLELVPSGDSRRPPVLCGVEVRMAEDN